MLKTKDFKHFVQIEVKKELKLAETIFPIQSTLANCGDSNMKCNQILPIIFQKKNRPI